MIDNFIKKKINTQLFIAEKLSNSPRPEAHDSAFLITDHIMERIGMCVYYEEKISNKPRLKSRDRDAILDAIKRESFEKKLECLFIKLGEEFKQKIMTKHEIRNDIQHKFITLNFSVGNDIVKDYLRLTKDILKELDWLESIIDKFIFEGIDLSPSITEGDKKSEIRKFQSLMDIKSKITHQFDIIELDKSPEVSIGATLKLNKVIPLIFDHGPNEEYILEIQMKLEELYYIITDSITQLVILHIFSLRWWRSYKKVTNRIKEFFKKNLSHDLEGFNELTEESDNIQYERYVAILEIYQLVYPEKIADLIRKAIREFSDYAFENLYRKIDYSFLRGQGKQFDLELVKMRSQSTSTVQDRIDKVRQEIEPYLT